MAKNRKQSGELTLEEKKKLDIAAKIQKRTGS